jgi:arylsulfatase A-like enzyme
MKPKEAGFDVFRGNLNAALKTYWDWDYQVQDEDTPPDRWRSEGAPVRSLPGVAPTTYAAVVQVADAAEWITTQEKEHPGRPWFAWLAFNLPHATAQLKPSQMAVPNADTLDETSRREMQACGGTFGSHETGGCSGEALMRAMTNSLDTLTGKLLAIVDRLDRNTVVIYIGDNGTPMYNKPNLDLIDNLYITRKGRGKGTVYESGARVPLLIRGPGVARGRVSTEYVHAADLHPTILTLAGLLPPARVPDPRDREGGTRALDGVSLAPILTGKARTVRDPDQGYLLTESLNIMTDGTRQVGARNARYKVICDNQVTPESCRFYDLIADPLEEFPLEQPAGCRAGTTPAEREWHYCRLTGLIRRESFFSKGR